MTGVKATYSNSASTQLQWSGIYSYVKLSRAEGVGSGATVGAYTDISTVVLSSPYYDKDLSGNTTYNYFIVPYSNGTTSSASSVVSLYTSVMAATDISAIFYDASAIKVSFTAPTKNNYSTSVYYTLTASGSLYITSVSGSSSPLLIQNLSSGTTYTCYIKNTLDSIYTGTSSGLSVSTSDIPPKPIIWYKFNSGDLVGTSLYDYGTVGGYDAISTATGLIVTSSPLPAVGTGCLYLNGSNYITVNMNNSSFYTNLSSSGFASNGWTPSNLGYSFTMWGYSSSWSGPLFVINGGGSFFTIKPNDRVSFGPSNYNGYPFSQTNNTWALYAIVFPAGSGSAHLSPKFYQYNSSSLQSTTITPQISTGGTIAGTYGPPFYIGYAGGASYISNSYFNGYIDDFRMYNVSLTDAQVLAKYNKIA